MKRNSIRSGESVLSVKGFRILCCTSRCAHTLLAPTSYKYNGLALPVLQATLYYTVCMYEYILGLLLTALLNLPHVTDCAYFAGGPRYLLYPLTAASDIPITFCT